ncbi:nuclear transport factor 2 family protein [Streptomyces sp. NPDC018711]|uniref:nuclear transport factor 2 family protein n=1 Tax=Streptomyces sp. NPDC018711 TaxID=3365052 RepID=UPI00378C67E8
MGTGRRGLAGIAMATALVAGAAVTVTTAEALPGGAATAARGDCPAARQKVERLEGRVTPNACAFMERQIAFGEMPTGTPPAPGDLAHPRVRAYLDIFDPEATLWEAGSAPQRGRTTIGTSITGSLRLAPGLTYRGTDVVADGSTVMFGQWNEVTLKGRTVAYPQIARNVLGDEGRTLQARRYYDRAALFRDTLPEAAPTPLFAGITDEGSPGDGERPGAELRPEAEADLRPEAGADLRPGPGFRARPGETAERLAAWNAGDVDALLALAGGARLSGPGLAAPLVSEAGRRAYLERLFATADLDLKAGQVAVGETTTYVEWHGTASVRDGGALRTGVPFGIVERFGPGGEWELYFDTLPLVATQAEIGALFQELAS